jgi:uncharacterized protein YjiS (DUF1127 family)
MHILHSSSSKTIIPRCSMELMYGGENGFGSGRIQKGAHMLVAILNFLRAWRRYNTTLNELYQLGDRELADIGIARSDIPRVAWDDAHR